MQRFRGLWLGLAATVVAQVAVAQNPASTGPAVGETINFGAPSGPPPPPPVRKTVTTPLYSVVDGDKVDPKTLMGWKTWRAEDCERCHGAQQQGLVGPSLVEALKILTKEQFHTTIMYGRLKKGMPNFNGSRMVNEHWQDLYAYLKGRSDGNILPGDLHPIPDGTKLK